MVDIADASALMPQPRCLTRHALRPGIFTNFTDLHCRLFRPPTCAPLGTCAQCIGKCPSSSLDLHVCCALENLSVGFTMAFKNPSSRSYGYNFFTQDNDQVDRSLVPDARMTDMFPLSNVGHTHKPSRAIPGSKQNRKRQHRAQQELASRLDSRLNVASHHSGRGVTTQAGLLKSHRPSLRTSDNGHTGGYSYSNDYGHQRHVLHPSQVIM